jgi:hypothetical protein
MKPKSPVRRIKFKGKYYVVGYYRGKQVERVRWSNRTDETDFGRPTKISLSLAKERFKQNLTFSDNKQRTFLANKTEIVDYTVNPQRGTDRANWRDKNIRVKDVNIRSSHYQYIMEGSIGSGQNFRVIYARSEQHTKDYPVSKAREECMDHFLRQLSEAKGGGYNVKDGWEKFDHVGKFREGVVYYN